MHGFDSSGIVDRGKPEEYMQTGANDVGLAKPLNTFRGECLPKAVIEEFAKSGNKKLTSLEELHLQNCSECRGWYVHYFSSLA